MKKISIIIPVYNEEKTIVRVLEALIKLRLGLKKEIIIVNDGSTDNSKRTIGAYIKKHKDKSNTTFKFLSKKNGGKGSAIKEGFSLSTGDIVTIQDADLEYNPEDYKKLIMPIISGKEKVVYGSRFIMKHKPKYRLYFFGNKFLTLITKILYNTKITDMETCYKVFDKAVVKNIRIKANRFDIEPEITAKVLRAGIRIIEIT